MSNFISNFASRLDGPMHFRFIAQPLMAILLAAIDGWRDARDGRPFYFWAICTDATRRRDLLREGWKRISRVFLIAIAMDLVYQLIVRQGFQPIETLWVALLLAIVPYLLLRGPVNRLMVLWRGRGTQPAARQ